MAWLQARRRVLPTCAALPPVAPQRPTPPRPHRYASISSRTKAVREREAAQIQRSSTLEAAPTSTAAGSKRCPASASQRSTFWAMKLRAGGGG